MLNYYFAIKLLSDPVCVVLLCKKAAMVTGSQQVMFCQLGGFAGIWDSAVLLKK
jgi:hypothetical protein